MAILATAVTLWDGAELCELSAGQEVPEWAAGRIGEHCLVAEPAPDGADAPSDADSDPGNKDAGNSADDNGATAPPVEAPKGAGDKAEDGADAPSDAPDFTKPASKRGRPRTAAQ